MPVAILNSKNLDLSKIHRFQIRPALLPNIFGCSQKMKRRIFVKCT